MSWFICFFPGTLLLWIIYGLPCSTLHHFPSLHVWWFLESSLGLKQRLPSSKILQNFDLNTSSHRNQSDFKAPAALKALLNLLPQGSPVHHLSLAHITKNKLLNNRWLAANSKCLQQWPFHPLGDDLPWFTSISLWKRHHHWQLLHCPEFNLPLKIRISI